MPTSIVFELQRLFDLAASESADLLLRAPYDAEYPSACEISNDGTYSLWRPCRQTTPVNFSGLASAVGEPIHQDIIEFYGSFWAGGLDLQSTEGQVSLIQLWHPIDFDRLIENLIGHFIAKQRARADFTVFFANTEPDSQMFLSIHNRTGAVLLEEPGKAPIREIEPDLTSFLSRLSALARPSGPLTQ